MRAKLINQGGNLCAAGRQTHINRFAAKQNAECHHGVAIVVRDYHPKGPFAGHSASADQLPATLDVLRHDGEQVLNGHRFSEVCNSAQLDAAFLISAVRRHKDDRHGSQRRL